MTTHLQTAKMVGRAVFTIAPVAFVLYVCLAMQGFADEYDTLRISWQNKLVSDATSSSSLTSINSKAVTYQSSMVPGGTMTSATTGYLWSDLPLNSLATGAAADTASGNIVSSFKRLESMALAYATPGCALYQNAALLASVTNGLDWMTTTFYSPTTTLYGNWYDWEVGGAKALTNTEVLLLSNPTALTTTQITNYCRAYYNFCPNSVNQKDYFWCGPLTGSNTTNCVLLMALQGALMGTETTTVTRFTHTTNTTSSVAISGSSLLAEARGNLSGQNPGDFSGKSVFDYVTSGDGFYADGSFVFHGNIAYTGQYGKTLLEDVADIVSLLNGSTWAISDPELANVYDWITKGFEPFLYNGAFMDMVRGRSASWSSATEYDVGVEVIAAIRKVATFAPPATATALTNFANSPRLASGQFHFAGMDRVVALRSGFGFGLSMSSSRIGNFENLFSSSNLKGWFTGDGMTYLYVGETDTQFTDTFWPTVDYTHLPGTTVEQGYVPQPSVTDQSWVGGAQVAGTYGSAGMALHPAASSTASSTLNGKKSWFMLDNKIVCLGSGISCTTGNAVDTTVENRRLGAVPTSNFTVNGVTYPPTAGWSASLSGSTWCTLDGVGGYYFPSSTSNLNASFVARSGSWTQIRPDDSDTTTYNDNYLKLWFSHGVAPSNASYAYVILPGRNASATSAYAQNPDVAIVANTTNIHAVKSVGLGVVSANFWATAGGTADWITVNKRASVVTLETFNGITVGISDPTQSITTPITVTLNRAGTGAISVDPGITVTQLTPKIIFTVNVNAAKGKTFQASFSQAPQSPVITSVLTANGNQGATFSYQITSSNAPTSYGATGLPPGLSVNTATGLISGNPTQTGTFTSTISATNPGSTGSASLTITIAPPIPSITSSLNLVGGNGQAFTYQITATSAPSSYGATGLPTGLSINTSTGVISGTPTGMTFPTNIILTATNAGGTGSATLVLSDVVSSFSTTGTWTCPANVAVIQIECWGGGGAGGSAYKATSNAFAGGGAGGSYSKVNSVTVTPGASYIVTVGAGGLSLTTPDLASAAGNDSSFGFGATTYGVAKGGAGGQTIINLGASGRAGLAGIGSAAGNIGDTVYAGGSGYAGQGSSGSPTVSSGGGGGGSAGTGSAGINATDYPGAPAVPGGGAGGAGKSGGNGNGLVGSIPGGGGGGARASATSTQSLGGAGGNGAVIVTVKKLLATVTLGGLATTYDGTPKAATATTTPSGLPVTFTYNGSATPPTTAGSYTVVGSVNSGSYSGSATGTLVIAEAVTSWRQLYFSTTADTGNAADSADPDGDGFTNAQEYRFGMLPTTADARSPLGASSSGTNFLLTFVARQAAGAGYAGLTRHYAVEWTPELANASSWVSIVGYSDVVGANQTVTVTRPIPSPNGFYRLKVWLQ